MTMTRGTFWKQPEWAICNKCGSPVYGVSVAEPYSETEQDEFGNRLVTGEVIFTVECHGQKWQWSNRDITPPDLALTPPPDTQSAVAGTAQSPKPDVVRTG